MPTYTTSVTISVVRGRRTRAKNRCMVGWQLAMEALRRPVRGYGPYLAHPTTRAQATAHIFT